MANVNFDDMTCVEKAKFIKESLAMLATKGNVVEVSLSGSDTTKFSDVNRALFMDFIRVASIDCPEVKLILASLEEPVSRRYGFGVPLFCEQR